MDTFDYLLPQLGMLLSGGNALPGDRGALSRTGRITVASRVVLAPGFEVPALGEQDVSAGDYQQARLSTVKKLGLFATTDVALGLYQGARVRSTRVGAVDLLLNVTYLPRNLAKAVSDGTRDVRLPESAFRVGYGVRLGMRSEGARAPSVTATVVRRELPPLDIIAQRGLVRSAGANALAILPVRLRATSWRIVLGKRYGAPIDLAGGIGRDAYRASAGVSYVVTDGNATTTGGDLTYSRGVTRTNAFAELRLRSRFLPLVLESGLVAGGKLSTYNSIAGGPNTMRTYFALGFHYGP
jgi:hypothetical protein